MVDTLFEHTSGCTPLDPCRSCKVISYLRSVLKEDEFNTFLSMLSSEKTNGVPCSFDDLQLLCRTRNTLINHGIENISQLIEKSRIDLLRLHGFGRTSLADLEQELGRFGLKLFEPPEEKLDPKSPMPIVEVRASDPDELQYRWVMLDELSSRFGIPYTRNRILKMEEQSLFPKHRLAPGGRYKKLYWLQGEIVAYLREANKQEQ